jgi:hypothetical protein
MKVFQRYPYILKTNRINIRFIREDRKREVSAERKNTPRLQPDTRVPSEPAAVTRWEEMGGFTPHQRHPRGTAKAKAPVKRSSWTPNLDDLVSSDTGSDILTGSGPQTTRKSNFPRQTAKGEGTSKQVIRDNKPAKLAISDDFDGDFDKLAEFAELDISQPQTAKSKGRLYRL